MRSCLVFNLSGVHPVGADIAREGKHRHVICTSAATVTSHTGQINVYLEGVWVVAEALVVVGRWGVAAGAQRGASVAAAPAAALDRQAAAAAAAPSRLCPTFAAPVFHVQHAIPGRQLNTAT